MLRFNVFENGAPAKSINLDGAHLLNGEHSPIRSEMKFENGQLSCIPRVRGAAALSILWPVKGFGSVMLETPRLLERNEPYNLHVELARGQFMRISLKREDWGLYDFPGGADVYREVDTAKERLISAITASDERTAAVEGEAAVAAGVMAGEAVGKLSAELLLQRRREANQFSRRPLGCRLDLAECARIAAGPAAVTGAYAHRLREAFDFVWLPFSWRQMEPQAGKHKTAELEAWVKAIHESKLQVWASGLVSFDPQHMPPWLANQRSFDRLRDAVAKHIRQVLRATGSHVHGWEVVSGIHATNPLRLSFEQIMDLTRTSAALVKQASPRSNVLLGITLPWGEYYAKDAQTIPPMLFAEMAVQGGVMFDGFGIDLRFNSERGSTHVRDLMQLSSLLDRFCNLGRPVHITACGVPSAAESTPEGVWHEAWTAQTQAEWLHDFYRVAFSKPLVETVTWQALADDPKGSYGGGLLGSDLSPKQSYEEMLFLRSRVFTQEKAAEPEDD